MSTALGNGSASTGVMDASSDDATGQFWYFFAMMWLAGFMAMPLFML